MTKRTRKTTTLNLTVNRRRVRILLDKFLFLQFLRNLHGRFWGIAGICIMIIGFAICFMIRPDMLQASSAISDFGNDVRTAPYFSGSVFFAAYGMWRWQKYLSRTWKRAMPVTGLVTLTVIGLYLIALMPVSWSGWPYHIHMFGVLLAGCSMLATVVFDGLLTKIRPQKGDTSWRILRVIAITLIITGGWITFGSTKITGWYNISLIGESLLLAGYLLWIVQKTYLGEGNRTILAKIAKRIVLID